MNNDEVEQEIKTVIYDLLHYQLEVDSVTAGEYANDIYSAIWEYIKDYD